jgi:Cu/Ag efflux protein CusF
VVLLAAFAAGLWGTVIRPAAYEVRGTIVGRPAADMILVRHEAVSALGMNAMDLMAVSASPALLDPVAPKTGDRVRLAVRQVNDQLVLIRIEKLP